VSGACVQQFSRQPCGITHLRCKKDVDERPFRRPPGRCTRASTRRAGLLILLIVPPVIQPAPPPPAPHPNPAFFFGFCCLNIIYLITLPDDYISLLNHSGTNSLPVHLFCGENAAMRSLKRLMGSSRDIHDSQLCLSAPLSIYEMGLGLLAYDHTYKTIIYLEDSRRFLLVVIMA